MPENLTETVAEATKYGNGYIIAMIGVVLCVLLCGVGSSIGLFKTGRAAAGVLSENPKKFGKLMVLVLLPATQGIYGFIIAIIAQNSIANNIEVWQGWVFLGAVVPMMLSGLITGILQGKSAVNCIYSVGKQDSLGGKLIIYPAMIEFYAILGLIISIMLINVTTGLPINPPTV